MSESNVPWNLKLSGEAKKSFESIVGLAEQQKSEKNDLIRDQNSVKRRMIVIPEPVGIAATEYVGTQRARRNHVDACIHYTEEQVYLKKHNQPIV